MQIKELLNTSVVRTNLMICFLIVLQNQVTAQESTLTKAQASLFQAENNFAKQAVTENIKAAFFKVLDEHSTVFRPYPVNGRWAYTIDPRPDSAYLFWKPELVEVSLGGDFGYSTGPWYARRSKFNEQGRKGFGNYVTIWSKDNNGVWHVLLDKGVNYANIGERAITVTGGTQNKKIVREKVSIASLLELDSKAYAGKEMDWYEPTTRLFQHLKWPFSIAADSLVKEFPKYTNWTPLNGRVAPYGDMAYTYGQFTGFINGKLQDGYYLRIWKKTAQQTWKIVLDLRTEN